MCIVRSGKSRSKTQIDKKRPFSPTTDSPLLWRCRWAHGILRRPFNEPWMLRFSNKTANWTRLSQTCYRILSLCGKGYRSFETRIIASTRSRGRPEPTQLYLLRGSQWLLVRRFSARTLKCFGSYADAPKELKAQRTVTKFKSFLWLCSLFRRFFAKFRILTVSTYQWISKKWISHLWTEQKRAKNDYHSTSKVNVSAYMCDTERRKANDISHRWWRCSSQICIDAELAR